MSKTRTSSLSKGGFAAQPAISGKRVASLPDFTNNILNRTRIAQFSSYCDETKTIPKINVKKLQEIKQINNNDIFEVFFVNIFLFFCFLEFKIKTKQEVFVYCITSIMQFVPFAWVENCQFPLPLNKPM